MTEATDNTIGATINNRYTIIRKIAVGGMATVYLANDISLGRNVAVKIMNTNLVEGEHRTQFINRFHLEARVAATLNNDHIVPVYDIGTFNGLDYIVMQFVDGWNLRQKLRSERTLSVREALDITRQILDGLAIAHENRLVHRDMKPENIMITQRGKVQITDFGLAKVTSQATFASSELLLGTAAYLAPELIEHNHATEQSDLYALGIMLFEMLTGTVPFVSENPVITLFKHVYHDVPSIVQYNSQFPEPLVAFIRSLTARNIELRPQNAQEALTLLTNSIIPQLTQEDLFIRHTITDNATDDQTTILPQKQLSPTPTPTPNDLTHITRIQDEIATPFPPSSNNTITNASQQSSDTNNANDSAEAGNHITLPTTVVDTTNSTDSEDTSITTAHTVPTSLQEILSNEPSAQDNDTSVDNTDSDAHHKGKKRWWITAILFLLTAIAAVAGYWYFIGSGSYKVIPNAQGIAPCSEQCKIAGTSAKDYEQLLRNHGFTVSTTQVYSDTVAKGAVVDVTPHVNERVSRWNPRVTIQISQGVRKATIPTNITECTANPNPLKKLEKAGFDANVIKTHTTEEYNLDIPEHCVISITPEPGTTLRHNHPVTVVISKGLQPVEIPDVVGKPKNEVMKTLQDLHLNVTTQEEHSDSIPSGIVMKITPDVHSQVHWKDNITLTISKGPEMVTIPDHLIGKSADDAQKALEALGLQVEVNRFLGGKFNMVTDVSPRQGTQVPLRNAQGKATIVTITVV